MCDKYKAMSLPTLMYFDPPATKGFTYEGNKTADELLSFAEELGKSCSPSSQDECSEEQKEMLVEYEAMAASELKEKASEITMKMDMAKMQMLSLIHI